jgi:hypothetical protein
MPVATFSWTISTSGDWNTASDWTPSGPPDPASMAVVAAAGGAYVVTVSLAENVSVGNLSINATSATVDVAGTLALANSLIVNNGIFDVLNAGTATIGSGGIAIGQGGTIHVSGSSIAAELDSTGSVIVGNIGVGALLAIGNLGTATGTDLTMLSFGAATGTGGTVTIDGGKLNGFGGIEIGGAGFGTLAVTNGGQVALANANLGIYVGSDAGGGGGVLLIDNGSTFSEHGRHFHVGGHNDSASVVVRNSSRLITSNDHGDGFLVAVAIEGPDSSISIESGSTWIANGQIGVGADKPGTLDVNNGLVDASGFSVYVASNSGGSGTLSVENGGTVLAGNLSTNPSGTDALGTIVVGPGGTLKISDSINNGPGGKIAVTGGTIVTKGVILGQAYIPGPAEITIGSGGTVSVTDFFSVGPGGLVTFAGGLLHSSASVTLSDNARLEGYGKLEGEVTLGSSATAIHSSGGTLQITGSVSGSGTLEVGSGSTLRLDTAPTNNLTVTFGSASSETLFLNNPNIGGASMFTAVTGVGTNDLIDFGGGITIQNVSYTPVSGGSNVTLNVTKGAITGTITLNGVQFTGGANQFAITTNNGDAALQAIPCFLRGTGILTDRGEIPVEALAIGDNVVTVSGAERPIVWIGTGRARVTPAHRGAATPIFIRKGALADNVPHHDLYVTKGHSLFVDGVLIPAEFLVNHRSILWDDRAGQVEFYHIELATHDVLLADGAPAETYRDDGNRYLFGNGNSAWGQLPKPPYAAVLTGGPIVDTVWQRLLDRSGSRPGLPLTDIPDLHLLADGKRVDGSHMPNGCCVFHLTERPNELRVMSRAGSPAELGLARDPRLLGVALRQIQLWQGARLTAMDASDPALTDGFHDFEPDDSIQGGYRWTDGEALLPSSLFFGLDGAFQLELLVGGATLYPLYGEAPERAAA